MDSNKFYSQNAGYSDSCSTIPQRQWYDTMGQLDLIYLLQVIPGPSRQPSHPDTQDTHTHAFSSAQVSAGFFACHEYGINWTHSHVHHRLNRQCLSPIKPATSRRLLDRATRKTTRTLDTVPTVNIQAIRRRTHPMATLLTTPSTRGADIVLPTLISLNLPLSPNP